LTYAFDSSPSLVSVTIPSSVITIQDSAFGHCGNLTNVTIPSGVASIGGSAFAGCKLISVTIPNGVTSIGNAAFAGCFNLVSVTISNSLTSIAGSLAWLMRFVAGKKPPRESGNEKNEKVGVAASGTRRDSDGPGIKPKRSMPKTQNQKF
jgi:hypothetical protein